MIKNCLIVLTSLFVFALISADAFGKSKPVFACSQKNPNLCKLSVVLTLDKLQLFKSEKMDLNLYREDKVVFEVKRYKIKSLKVDSERNVFVADVLLKGRWRLKPAMREQILSETILARSESVDF